MNTLNIALNCYGHDIIDYMTIYTYKYSIIFNIHVIVKIMTQTAETATVTVSTAIYIQHTSLNS